MGQFANDIEAVRQRARQNMEAGAVTGGYKADREQVLKVLNEVLATEIVCTLRYLRHYYMAMGINSESVKDEFREHADQEQEYAAWIAERIVQLGGAPNYNPDGMAARSHSQYVEGGNLLEMIKEDLVAERIAIETYSEIVRWLGNDDPVTRRLIERILESENQHAEDMASLLEQF